MHRHLFDTRSRWLWPASWSLAVGLVALLWLVPAAWWEVVWPRGELRDEAFRPLTELATELLLIEILQPPPAMSVVPDRSRLPSPPAPVQDPDWWERAWHLRIERDLGRSSLAVPDTLIPGPMLDLWGAGATVALIMSAPDSVLQARLWELVQEEDLRRTDINGLFRAVARARAYVDMKRREAAIFGEFGRDQIRVPD